MSLSHNGLNPCIKCLTYPICRNQVHESMKQTAKLDYNDIKLLLDEDSKKEYYYVCTLSNIRTSIIRLKVKCRLYEKYAAYVRFKLQPPKQRFRERKVLIDFIRTFKLYEYRMIGYIKRNAV